MKKLLLLFFTILYMFNCVSAQETTLLKGEVSAVPDSFYGTWRVISKRIETDSASKFKEKNIDIWNIYRINDVITLCNPFNGAQANIKVERADTKQIVFTKTGNYDRKILNDKVELNIEQGKFIGYDTLILETHVNGKIQKVEYAKYKLIGEKIAGELE